jgi:hypothetical protein
MSKISLSGNSLGSGTLTISAPNTNVDRVLDLPDSTGTVLNDQSNIEAQVKTATNASGSAPIFSCRSWVNFNGTGTVAIRASGNVSSITDNGTGDYTVNFTTAMPDANYSAVVTTGSSSTGLASTPYLGQHSGTGTTSFATGAYRFWSRQGAFGVDADLLTVCIFR